MLAGLIINACNNGYKKLLRFVATSVYALLFHDTLGVFAIPQVRTSVVFFVVGEDGLRGCRLRRCRSISYFLPKTFATIRYRRDRTRYAGGLIFSISFLVCRIFFRLEAPKTIDSISFFAHMYSSASSGAIAPEANTDIATARNFFVAMVFS